MKIVSKVMESDNMVEEVENVMKVKNIKDNPNMR